MNYIEFKVAKNSNIPQFNEIIKQWYIDKNPESYILYNTRGEILSFILLSRCDFDPLDQQKFPHIINYIYTYKKFRKQGYALQLLNHIINKNIEFTAFCDNKKSDNLFKKAGCLNNGNFNNTVMYRSNYDV